MSTTPAPADVERELEEHRPELIGYCYRMLASPFEAEDAVHETMLRAWRSMGEFERRSSLRVWLYRIATNVCLDMSQARQRRALPMDLGPAREQHGRCRATRAVRSRVRALRRGLWAHPPMIPGHPSRLSWCNHT